MEVRAAASPGQASFMLACLVEEFARIGTPREEILRLFDDPFYRATHGLAAVLGPEEARTRVDSILDRFGVHRARTATTSGPGGS